MQRRLLFRCPLLAVLWSAGGTACGKGVQEAPVQMCTTSRRLPVKFEQGVQEAASKHQHEADMHVEHEAL